MVEYAVDRTDGEIHTCPHCDQPFARAEYVILHVGLEHPDSLSADDREHFTAVYRGENAEIKRFRLKALALLIGLYFTFLFVYLAIV